MFDTKNYRHNLLKEVFLKRHQTHMIQNSFSDYNQRATICKTNNEYLRKKFKTIYSYQFRIFLIWRNLRNLRFRTHEVIRLGMH